MNIKKLVIPCLLTSVWAVSFNSFAINNDNFHFEPLSWRKRNCSTCLGGVPQDEQIQSDSEARRCSRKAKVIGGVTAGTLASLGITFGVLFATNVIAARTPGIALPAHNCTREHLGNRTENFFTERNILKQKCHGPFYNFYQEEYSPKNCDDRALNSTSEFYRSKTRVTNHKIQRTLGEDGTPCYANFVASGLVSVHSPDELRRALKKSGVEELKIPSSDMDLPYKAAEVGLLAGDSDVGSFVNKTLGVVEVKKDLHRQQRVARNVKNRHIRQQQHAAKHRQTHGHR